MSDTIQSVVNGAALVPMNGELAGLFDPQSAGSLSGVERELLSALLSQDERIDVAIPETIGDESLWQALELCCKVESRIKALQGVLKMLIGRALILMETRPEMYRARGFQTLDQLMSDGERGLPKITGISRPELYNAKRIAKSFPTISMLDFREVGFTKLRLLTSVVKQADSNSQSWVDRAKIETEDELKQSIYKSDNGIAPGSLDYETVIFSVTKEEKERIQEFLGKPETVAVCGTSMVGPILCRMIEECDLEWIVRAQQAQDERRDRQ